MSELDYLTDAEREALEGEDLNDTTQDEAENAETGEETGDGLEGDAGAEGETQAGDPPADPEAETHPGVQSFSVPTADLGEIDKAIAQLQQAREDLEQAYESGDSELTYAEHRAKLREVNDNLLALNAEKAKAAAIQEMNAAYRQEWWQREIRSFKREAAKEGVDYDADPKLEAAWDKAVRFLGSDPDNAEQDAAWFLKEAHEMVKARFKLGAPAVPPAAQRLSKVDEALAQRRANAKPPAKTLANLPQAGIETEGQTEFSYLENLSGLQLERALAKMSPEQQDRYLTT